MTIHTPDHSVPQRVWAGLGHWVRRLLCAAVWDTVPRHASHPQRHPQRRVARPEYPAPSPTRLPFPGDLVTLTARFPVLHTDDEASLLHLFSMLLAREGLSVITAQDTRDALRLCQQVPLSLVISDISKPVLSGLDLLQLLRSNPGTAHLPLMFVTAHACSPEEAARRMGANAYFVKPILPHEFIRAVREALTTWGNWTVPPPRYDPVVCRALATQMQQGNGIARA